MQSRQPSFADMKQRMVESVKQYCAISTSSAQDVKKCAVCEKEIVQDGERLSIIGMPVKRGMAISYCTCSETCAITLPAYFWQTFQTSGKCGWCERFLPHIGDSAVLIWAPKDGRAAYIHCCPKQCAEAVAALFGEGCNIVSVSIQSTDGKANSASAASAAAKGNPTAQYKKSPARQGKKMRKPMGEPGYCPVCGADGQEAFKCSTCGAKSCSSKCARTHRH